MDKPALQSKHHHSRGKVLQTVRAEEVAKAVAASFVVTRHGHIRLQRCDRLDLVRPLIPRLIVILRGKAIICKGTITSNHSTVNNISHRALDDTKKSKRRALRHVSTAHENYAPASVRTVPITHW